MPDPARILLIRPSALGDVCRTVPVLVSLKRRWPGAEIDWLVQDAYAPAIAAHPDLHEAVAFPRSRMQRFWRDFRVARETFAWLSSLRKRRYDLVVDCQGLLRSGVFSFVTRAPIRVGYANAAEFGWVGMNHRHHVPRRMHSVDRMLALLRAERIPIDDDMRLYTPPADRAALDPRLRPPARYAVVAPGSRWTGKRWPAERFASVVRSLLAEERVDAVALVGAESEREHCQPITDIARANPRVIDLIGRTSVGGLMAVIESAAVVIANDSAALHMGVGFDRPIVGLFGPTRMDLVGPYDRDGDVIQHILPGESLDHKNHRRGRAQMERIEIGEVLDAVRARLSSEDSPARAGARAIEQPAAPAPVPSLR